MPRASRSVSQAAILILVLASGGCSRHPPGPTAAGSPLILISVDTLRSDHLPAYGYKDLATPHFDALAADSVLFERAYSHCPMTLPSHCSILTGLTPPEHGVRSNKGYALDPKLTTLAQRLKTAGYRTGAAVSSAVLRRQTGIDRGFDFFVEPGGKPGSRTFAQTGGDVALKQALSWLDALGAGDKFFLMLHLYDPHTPYEAPEPYASRYKPYDAEIAYTDELVGTLLDHLKSNHLYDPALIVLLSDHGEGLGDHVEKEHGLLLYREALQVPLLVKLPRRQRAGERVAATAALIDVLPTVLGLLGLDHAGLPGRSLFSPPAPERPIYSETLFTREEYGWAELRSSIKDDAHYIQAPHAELYDIRRDPAERRNLLPEKRLPEDLVRAVNAYGAGAQSTQAVSREDEERLAALGYVGNPEPAGQGQSGLPDPKDRIQMAMDLKDEITRIGKTDSLEPELRVLDLLTRLDLQREDLRRTIASDMLHAGRPRPAQQVLAQSSDSPDPQTQLLLGEIAATLGRPQEARARFERVLATDSNSAAAHKDMGILLLGQRNLAQAGRWLEEAVRLDESQAEAWNGLGVVRAQSGDAKGAVAAWRRAVTIDPALTDAWYNLATALKDLGDRTGAAEAMGEYNRRVPRPGGGGR